MKTRSRATGHFLILLLLGFVLHSLFCSSPFVSRTLHLFRASAIASPIAYVTILTKRFCSLQSIARPAKTRQATRVRNVAKSCFSHRDNKACFWDRNTGSIVDGFCKAISTVISCVPQNEYSLSTTTHRAKIGTLAVNAFGTYLVIALSGEQICY